MSSAPRVSPAAAATDVEAGGSGAPPPKEIVNTATWWVPPVWLFALYNWVCAGGTALLRSSNIILALLIVDRFISRNTFLSLSPGFHVAFPPSPPPPPALPTGTVAPPPPSGPPPPPAYPQAITDLLNGLEDSLYYDEEELYDEVYDHLRVVNRWDGFGSYLMATLAVYILVHLLLVLLAYGLDIAAKWLFLGRRKPGVYAWDSSSYCMRWNLYLGASCVRRGLLDYLQGSAYLVWFFQAHGATIGDDVCLYPAGSDPMMTEPDLVTVGNGACLNKAFVICHTNSKGLFTLQPIQIGAHATLRTWSRLMGGGTLGENTRLLEHTTTMPGDSMDAGTIWQGWPVKTMLVSSDYWKARGNHVQPGRKEQQQKHWSAMMALTEQVELLTTLTRTQQDALNLQKARSQSQGESSAQGSRPPLDDSDETRSEGSSSCSETSPDHPSPPSGQVQQVQVVATSSSRSSDSPSLAEPSLPSGPPGSSQEMAVLEPLRITSSGKAYSGRV